MHKPAATLASYPGYRLTGPDGMLSSLTDEQMKDVLADKGLDLPPRPPCKEIKEAPVKLAVGGGPNTGFVPLDSETHAGIDAIAARNKEAPGSDSCITDEVAIKAQSFEEAPVKDTTTATLSTIVGGKRIEGELGTAAGDAVAEAFVRKSMGLPPNPADYPGSRFQRRFEEATGELLPYQPTLDDKVFAKYIPEYQVGLKLTKGSAKLPLASFGKLLSGEKLERGREVIVTARYFAKGVYVPAVYDEGRVVEGDGMVELELLNIRSIEVGAQILHKLSPWKPCDCLVPYDLEIDGEYPPNRNVLGYPLDGWSALCSCTTCSGDGYVRLTEKPGEWEKGEA
jgi:hypothetical protein